MDQDGKASLVSPEAKYDLETDEGILEVKEIDCAQDAADVCPSQCILITNKEKNA
jgi:ferredoxin